MAASTKKADATATGTLTCPECGKTFSRAAALGAHRNRAHGIAGASKRATAQSTAAAGGSSKSRPAAPARGAGRRRSAVRGRRNGAGGVDRNALLQALFPAGIPPREDVITAVNSWLDEGERLARLR